MKNIFAGLGIMVAIVLAAPGTAVAGETGFLQRSVTLDGVSYRYQVYLPAQHTPTRAWPIALFLHGSGERGDDGRAQAQVGIGSAIRADPGRFPLVVVMPQARRDTRWTGAMAAQALKALDQSIAEFNGDPRRVYLTGLSMGGQGVWFLAAHNPNKFAAIAPVCGFVVGNRDANALGLRQEPASSVEFAEFLEPDAFTAFARRIGKVPLWVFHGSADTVVPVEQSRQMVQAMRQGGGEVRFSDYAGVDHNSWDRAYAEPELVPWLLSHQLGAR
ncbi:prolyl oligopeptidase family serine peptidase [Rhodoferax sp.]|uniref:carboxylesterase family protein n=1 Tax=Rhodoferax sp. TaxID=50421 RepID=UPI0027525EB6|nr:PHB depolymerase family esterase [Rhodoferax sp.]